MKDYFWKLLDEKSQKFAIKLSAKVVLDNHYHIIIETENGSLIPKFIKELHGASAHFIRKNMPETINYDQVFGKPQTAFDIRQRRRLKSANPNYLRGLKSANPTNTGIANFSSRITDPEVLRLLNSKEAPVWYQYFDHSIRNEKDFFMHLNYIHQNPVKHGLTSHMSKYKWSSIHEYVKREGKEWIIDCFRRHPIADFQPKGIAD